MMMYPRKVMEMVENKLAVPYPVENNSAPKEGGYYYNAYWKNFYTCLKVRQGSWCEEYVCRDDFGQIFVHSTRLNKDDLELRPFATRCIYRSGMKATGAEFRAMLSIGVFKDWLAKEIEACFIGKYALKPETEYTLRVTKDRVYFKKVATN